jgi:acyl-CoA oxidase
MVSILEYMLASTNSIQAYSEKLLVENFYAALQNSPLSKDAALVMNHLFQLYALYTMDSDSRAFATTNAVTSASLDELQDAILILMTEKIRPHAVKLVDSWAMPD